MTTTSTSTKKCSNRRVWHPVKRKCVRRNSKNGKDVELIELIMKRKKKTNMKRRLIIAGISVLILAIVSFVIYKKYKGNIKKTKEQYSIISEALPIIKNFTKRYAQITQSITDYFYTSDNPEIPKSIPVNTGIRNELIKNLKSSSSNLDDISDSIAIKMVMPGGWKWK